MTYPALIRASLTVSRNAGLSFPEAWANAMEHHPLEDFREAHFTDAEWEEFAGWFKGLMSRAYLRRSERGIKPTRLEPPDSTSEAARRPHRASQTPSRGKFIRCKSGDRCDRPATHSRFCQRHYDELTPIREAFEREEAERDPIEVAERWRERVKLQEEAA